MPDRLPPLPPDLAEDAGPELAALLAASAETLRREPDPFTRARHLKAMAAAREPRRLRPVPRIATTAAAVAAGAVALASVGALPGPVQQVAAAVASQVGWELPDSRAEVALTPGEPSHGGTHATGGAADGDPADGPTGPTGPTGPAADHRDEAVRNGAGAEPGSDADDRAGATRPRGRSPDTDGQGLRAPEVPRGLASVPLDAWERIPAWLELRREGLLPLPGRRGTSGDNGPERVDDERDQVGGAARGHGPADATRDRGGGEARPDGAGQPTDRGPDGAGQPTDRGSDGARPGSPPRDGEAGRGPVPPQARTGQDGTRTEGRGRSGN